MPDQPNVLCIPVFLANGDLIQSKLAVGVELLVRREGGRCLIIVDIVAALAEIGHPVDITLDAIIAEFECNKSFFCNGPW